MSDRPPPTTQVDTLRSTRARRNSPAASCGGVLRLSQTTRCGGVLTRLVASSHEVGTPRSPGWWLDQYPDLTSTDTSAHQLGRVAGSGPVDRFGNSPQPVRLVLLSATTVREQVIAINLGGAFIPLAVDLFLLPRAPVEPLLGAVGGVAAASYALARPGWPVGIVLPPFVPPLAA